MTDLIKDSKRQSIREIYHEFQMYNIIRFFNGEFK
jgi:hypothetical protein